MSSAAKKILEHALALPEDERLRLAEALFDSLPRESAEETRQAWVDEALRRAEEVARGEGTLVDLDDALATLSTPSDERVGMRQGSRRSV